MLALVTGSTGFIGSQLCRVLLEKGYRVRAFHRQNSPTLNLNGLEVEHYIGDITQADTLRQAMRGVQIVFHTAAQLGNSHNMERHYTVTVEGTRNVLQTAINERVERLVHTSSVAALGVPIVKGSNILNKNSHHYLMDETHTWNFPPQRWIYGYAKYLAELEVQYAVAQGIDALIVNPAVVIGAGDLNRISGNLILYAARKSIPISTSGGSNVVSIQDVVIGHLSALEHGRTGERYILGNENLSHTQFLTLIAEVVGVPPPPVTISAGALRCLAHLINPLAARINFPLSTDALYKAGYYFYYDNSKAKKDLGVSLSTPVRQAIQDAFAWYLNKGYLQ